MKLTSIKWNNKEVCGLWIADRIIGLPHLNEQFDLGFAEDLLSLLETGQFYALDDWYKHQRDKLTDSVACYGLSSDQVEFAPLYRRPRKIWGIGLNYPAHASDLAEVTPRAEPASFMKPDTSIIGYGDLIQIPTLSEQTTGEAELGLIIGKKCKDVPASEWQAVVAGVTTIIDMTAEDILKRNPRNLTQSKSFDTFFSFGPMLATLDEFDDLFAHKVATIHNTLLRAENSILNMTFALDYLVAYHSQIMTLLPGDVISTGTPGAAQLQHGDLIECHIEGLYPLRNNVVDLKRK